jgi:hypothetical protein
MRLPDSVPNGKGGVRSGLLDQERVSDAALPTSHDDETKLSPKPFRSSMLLASSLVVQVFEQARAFTALS